MMDEDGVVRMKMGRGFLCLGSADVLHCKIDNNQETEFVFRAKQIWTFLLHHRSIE